jgi:Ca-activated chloride channel family protein
VLAGRYSGAAEGDLLLEGTLNGQPRKISQKVKFVESGAGNEFIPQLWATRRVGFLLDEIRLRGESKELRDEVVDLARRFAVVTPYTSYLIVEDEARRGVPVTLRSMQDLDRNEPAKLSLERSYRALPEQKSGDVASFGARANKSLKEADSFGGSLVQSQVEATRAAVAAAPMADAAKQKVEKDLAAVEQNSRVVNGKAFYQNGTQWIDGETQQRKAARNRRIQFASEEYFKLLSERADAAAWLALGPNVQFTLDDTSYEISE